MKSTAILLMAAGQSTRMQAIKQLLPWNGTSLVNHTIESLIATRCEHIVVVLGANATAIQKQLKASETNITNIVNPNWQKGLGNSIAHGIAHIVNEIPHINAILIALADQPLISAKDYNQLIKTYNTSNGSIIATTYGNKAGVPALFPIEIAKELTQLHQDFGAKELLKKYHKLVIPLDLGKRIVDLDTPETYSAYYNSYHTT